MIAVPGRWDISNRGAPMDNASKYLDFILKPLMQDSWSHSKDSGYFLIKIKNNGKIPRERYK